MNECCQAKKKKTKVSSFWILFFSFFFAFVFCKLAMKKEKENNFIVNITQGCLLLVLSIMGWNKRQDVNIPKTMAPRRMMKGIRQKRSKKKTKRKFHTNFGLALSKLCWQSYKTFAVIIGKVYICVVFIFLFFIYHHPLS